MWFIENYDNKASLGINCKKMLVEEQSPIQKINIYDTEYFGKLLTLDDLVMCSEKDEFVYHEMIVHMPLCTHPNPENILVIGGGDGGTIREILKHESVKQATLCEIDERVVRLCQEHMPSLAGKLTDPKVSLHFEDGFKFLKNYENHFDVIITDSTDPIGECKALFEQDYFRLVKKALKPDGILVSQSESPWFYADTINEMTENMCHVFNTVETYIAMIPLYPSGLWTMTYASNNHSLHKPVLDKSRLIAKTCQYYNTEVHQAALALPNFLKAIIHTK